MKGGKASKNTRNRGHKQQNKKFLTYVKNVATTLMISIKIEADNAFLNIWGSAFGEIAY